MRTLMEGIGLGESPRWHEGRLWFSDWVAHQVIALDEDGNSEVMARIDAFPFSIDWLPKGPMLVTAGRELLRMEDDGSLVSHRDLSEFSEFGWNELVVDGNGNAYVNGPGFDMMGGADFVPGIVVLLRPDGSAEKVAEGVAFPNGMAVTPDDATLIVADSYAKELLAFDIAADGAVGNRRTWADLRDGVPDGICIDAEGAIWYADVPGRSCVRVREGGEVLQTIEFDRGCFACMLGGANGRNLFIMAQEWTGPEGIFNEPRTGQVVTVDAPATQAGHP
jgi:sugar lactone lactonase YvrE